MKHRPVSKVEFGKWISRCGFRKVKVHGVPTYDIPDAAAFAAAVLRQAGLL
jgi:hypothetical protein